MRFIQRTHRGEGEQQDINEASDSADVGEPTESVPCARAVTATVEAEVELHEEDSDLSDAQAAHKRGVDSTTRAKPAVPRCSSFSCDACEKTYRRRVDLLHHKNVVHNNGHVERHACRHCGRLFLRVKDCRHHEQLGRCKSNRGRFPAAFENAARAQS